ncbi:MAG: hypothetical protein A2632_00960 [Candidatus Pacebacteria bacterium RIFCSPHIGHO2_01_FULL_46_16]|nr:MAG: hypothetical protein A2632_00960 [Candidatus Pacebacteria bacterium RIFCSPHIGHO2_01_FULL_46_16]OGJ20590.1 MAG: hypothetical protein A3J60_02555 [Candidatus Pacebacteria bacterium RIFCSPHIGHO2_02_FULL_46_9]
MPVTPVIDHLELTQPASSEPVVRGFFGWWSTRKTWQKIALIALLSCTILIGIGISLALKTYQVLQALRSQAAVAQVLTQETYSHFKAQNLPPVQENLTKIDTQLAEMKATYAQLAFYAVLPIVRNYYLDGEHAFVAAQSGLSAARKSIDTIVPYADVLGFSGEGSFQGGTAEDRLKIVLETLDKIAPILDEIATDLIIAETELAQIAPQRYPETVQGMPVRAAILQTQGISSAAVDAVTEFRPVIEQLPSIAGARGERKKYLVLFQNDAELRPTGGFLTAFAVINVENGKVEPEKSDDIYELDKKYKTKLPIPEELGRYLITEKSWNLRDMNISPDFKVSMDQFFPQYSKVPGEPNNVDGIITVNTKVLTDLLSVLGPVEVPGYGLFSSKIDPRCDCPEIIYILSEIITRPTPYLRDDRKGVIGPLMRSVLTKAYASPKTVWPQLFQTGMDNIASRHIQFYFLDEKAQQTAEVINAAGRLKPVPDSDFLAIVNANLAGAKSNLFVTYEVEQTVSAPQDGFITKQLEITYKNSRQSDNCNLEAGLLCLNSTLKDWTRIYVPQGSTLVSSEGFKEAASMSEELGFSVINGFFTLEPLGTAKIKLEYKVPYANDKQYQLQIWKQGGIDNFPLLLDTAGNQEQLDITKDTAYSTTF